MKHLIILLILLSIPAGIKPDDELKDYHIYGYTIVTDLRLRSEPNIKSSVIGVISKPEKVQILSISKSKTTAKIKDKDISAPWYKISYNAKTAWIFGGAVSLSPPPENSYENVISNSHEGYTILTKSGNKIVLSNTNFKLSGNDFDCTFHKFQNFHKGINYFEFVRYYYGYSNDKEPDRILINADTGNNLIIPGEIYISPQNNYIASVYYYEPGGSGILEIYKLEKGVLNKIYSKNFFRIIFRSAEWISPNKLRIGFIRDWNQTEKEFAIYEIGKELSIAKK
ncbi:MAG: SH3 domain-containing protein [Spirochaetes bacterium]|nr:SH3 domain-containing protein [Spirochaetota bacterium]